jgi:hypothetical protein
MLWLGRSRRPRLAPAYILRDTEPNFEVDSWTTHGRPGCTLQHTVLTVFGKQFE